MTNHPVQGTAADVFKMAGNRLAKVYRQYNTRIIVPFHDSFVFEVPTEKLKEVTQITIQIMCDTVREFFPELRPGAEENISCPSCWNKDGDEESLLRWLEDPLAEVHGSKQDVAKPSSPHRPATDKGHVEAFCTSGSSPGMGGTS